ncbi:MAG: acyl-CoA dehydrogenase family protein [Rhizobium sp.]|nr:acyl-CoA dehydrogenase family protein [Rhizobium sp.]
MAVTTAERENGILATRAEVMGSITQLHDKFRPVPQPLLTDDQVRSAIDQLHGGGAPPVSVLDAAARLGLLAVSVPSDFGGADLPNDVIAELLTATAGKSEAAATLLATHFVALELVRTSGTFEQRRGVYNRVILGERFRCPSLDLLEVDFHPDGIGLRLEPSASLPGGEGEDWTVLPVGDPAGKRGVILLSAAVSLGAAAPVPTEEGSPAAIHLPGDNFLVLGEEAQHLAKALSSLLKGAVLLGGLDHRAAEGQGSPGTPEAVGAATQSVFAELLSAMIARLACMIDARQVGANTVAAADLSATIAAMECLNVRVLRGDPV